MPWRRSKNRRVVVEARVLDQAEGRGRRVHEPSRVGTDAV